MHCAHCARCTPENECTAASPHNIARIKPTGHDADLPVDRSSVQQEHRRTYSTRRMLLAEAAPLVFVLAVPLLVHAGFFSVMTGMLHTPQATHAERAVQGAHTVSLLRAATHVDPNPSKGGGDILIDADALVPERGGGFSGDDMRVSHSSGEISVYVVREGDSLSQIAEMYDVSANTILWANNIRNANLIQPGDSLVILPISGVRHTVQSGDSLAKIAQKYNGEVEDIMAYNGLASESDIRVGQVVVIPGGEVAPPPTPSRTASAPSAQTPPSGGSGYFVHPLPGSVRTQGLHGYNGVDFGARTGTAIRAAAAGEVIVSRNSGWNGGYGNYVVIKHPNGTQTLYAHTSENYVSVGQRVAQGETIAAVGSTGRSTGAHLHFEVRGAANPF